MRSLIAAVMFGLLLAPCAARADVIEIPLPELCGAYPYFEWIETIYFRSATVHLPAVPTGIRGAQMRVRGTVQVGELECVAIGLRPWPMSVDAYLGSGVVDGWFCGALTPSQSGPYDLTLDFLPGAGGPPSWDFLMDGEGPIELDVAPAPYLDCWHTDPSDVPTATVDEAVFIIDADFAVPTQAGTWGRVKALYS